MKFKQVKNSPKLLKESLKWPSGKDLDTACDVIDAMLQDREKFELTDEEVSILSQAYDIMYWIAPNLGESLKEAVNKPVKLYEEDWDMDESLKESATPNLSDKSNSISGLLLDNKDKIDAAASQQELIKVCKDALAEKGGAKAQQFLAVLASKKGHYAALKYVYDFILAGEGMRSADSKRKTKPAHMKEALEEDFSTEQDLIDAGFEQAGYRKQYDFYRKKIDGKGTWYAVDTKSGNVFPITWSQAVGYDPIDSAEGLSMKLGSMLLPH